MTKQRNDLATGRITDDFILRYLDLVAEQLKIIARGFNQEGDEERYAWIKVQLELNHKVIDAEHERREARDSQESALAVIDRDYGRKPHRYINHFGIEHDCCPSCYEKTGRNEILYAGQKYCSVCGQAIDIGNQNASGRSIFAPGMKLRDNGREPLS